MNILMMTNTYLPNVCGVARSVVSFSDALRARGHRVLIVAPAHPDAEDEPDVVRVPALQHITGNDIPVRLPIPGYLSQTLTEFHPDVVHVHHPFLLGSTGLRIAATRSLPVVFTHHTMYEHYTHYIPGDSAAMERFTVRLVTEFANLCDYVVAPSESVAAVLHERGVKAPIMAVPTGIDTAAFAGGNGARSREKHGIPQDAFVVGHVGRLALEKNLLFLSKAVARFLQMRPEARSFIVGNGPIRDEIPGIFEEAGVRDRLHMSDHELVGQDLFDAYRSMNVKAFASVSETQGMVLAEAMSAGAPVVAIDASGARDIVRDQINGRLVYREDVQEFADALAWVHDADPRLRQLLARGVAETAREYSMDNCVEKLIDVYSAARRLCSRRSSGRGIIPAILRRVEEEYQLWARVGCALREAVMGAGRFTNREAC